MSAPERRPAAILYVELRNFTRLSETLEAPQVLELANEFFSFTGKHIRDRGGRVLSLHNDSVIASFSGEDRLEFSIYALKAAQQIQREFEPIGERWQNDYALPAAVALGLHGGDTVFGMAGPDDRQEYVAFGDCVSIAERLVHRARAGEIVLSLAFMRAIGATVKTLGAEELPPLEIARRPPIAIYGIVLNTRLDFT
jgi:adenylate cyclase